MGATSTNSLADGPAGSASNAARASDAVQPYYRVGTLVTLHALALAPNAAVVARVPFDIQVLRYSDSSISR